MVNQFCGTALPRGAMVEKASGKPFRLQRSGMCKIVVRYECSLPSKFDLGDDTGFLSIIHSIEVAETEHEKLGIFRQVLSIYRQPFFTITTSQPVDTFTNLMITMMMVTAILTHCMNHVRASTLGYHVSLFLLRRAPGAAAAGAHEGLCAEAGRGGCSDPAADRLGGAVPAFHQWQPRRRRKTGPPSLHGRTQKLSNQLQR